VGRTGTLFAFQQYGVLPDVVSFAKGIAGGLPLGGILANEKCRSVLGPGMHATTFGGNPIACAGGCEVLKIIDDKLLDSVKENGAYIRNFIESLGSEYVVCTRGLGLMIGVQVKGATHKELAMRMLENGLLVLTAGSDALRLLPPLTITREEIDRGLAVMEKVLLK
jgi:acetylornithine/N-succinyldiaminopimelate aminotransferase